ncbi:MAG TPA: inorganic phosphate transporter [Gemmatimonadales bacterium]|jgi:PiT family inorganic phosphate transporter
MPDTVWFVLAIVGIALLFDYINGFHDAANAIATVVSTRVLSPLMAVGWAAFFNFVAAFGFGTAVAKTIGSGLIDISIVDPLVILGGLCGAITWNLITWYYGIPSSSSHALIGGYGGAAVAKAGIGALFLGGWVKPILFIAVAPFLGMALGMGLMVGTVWTFRRASPRGMDRGFRAMQLISSAAFSLSHGTNDAQKTMGIVVGLLVASEPLFRDFPVQAFHLTTLTEIPRWVILSAHFAIALGTFSGGWRIVRTMGSRLTKLTPVHGFCAETGGALSVFVATWLGVPVSTTHTITGSIVGVGATQRASAVRWGLATRILWAWFLTIPAAAGLAGVAFLLLHTLLR